MPPEPKRKSNRRARLETLHRMRGKRFPKKSPFSYRKTVRTKEAMDGMGHPEYSSIAERYYDSKTLPILRSAQKAFNRKHPLQKITILEAADILVFHAFIRAGSSNFLGGRLEGTDWVLHYTMDNLMDDYAYVRLVEKIPHPKTVRQVQEFIQKVIAHRLGIPFERFARENQKFARALSLMNRIGTISTAGKISTALSISFSNFYRRVKRAGKLNTIAGQQDGLRLLLVDAVVDKFPEKSVVLEKGVERLKRNPRESEMRKIRERIPNLDKLSHPLFAIRDARLELIGDKISAVLEEEIRVSLAIADIVPLAGGERLEDYTGFYQWMHHCLKRQGNRKYLAKLAIEWFG